MTKRKTTTRFVFDTETAMGDLPWIDSAIQHINEHLKGDSYFSGETVVTWGEGNLRLPWQKMRVYGDGRVCGPHELKQMIETPFREYLPSPEFTGKMKIRANNGELSGRPLFK